MDPHGFFRAMDARSPFILQSGLCSLNGLPGLNGLNPLATINGISLELPPDVRGRTKLAREEAALEVKVVHIIVSGDWASLKPNSGKSVAVGDHHICVAFRDDPNSGYRIWEWHGHILMYDDEEGYTPEYIYGNYFQPLLNKVDDGGDVSGVGVGLGGLINAPNTAPVDKKMQATVLHRNSKKEPSTE